MTKLIHGNALEELDKLIEQGIKVDAIITDPPYKTITGGSGRTEHKYRPGGCLTDNDNFGWKIDYKTFLPQWLSKCYQILKDDSHAYFMVNHHELENFLRESRLAGFKLHNVLVWDKGNKVINRWYMKQVEYIVFCRKGHAKPINDKGTPNLLAIPNIIGTKTHPTEKPVELMKIFVANSTQEGQVVLDPFMGSGSAGVASKQLNRSFIGIELDEKYFAIAKERVKNESIQKSTNCVSRQ